jgi:hypothetical protein
VVLLIRREEYTIDPWYAALLVVGTAGVSFGVGWALGYLTESGLTPGSEGRE